MSTYAIRTDQDHATGIWHARAWRHTLLEERVPLIGQGEDRHSERTAVARAFNDLKRREIVPAADDMARFDGLGS